MDLYAFLIEFLSRIQIRCSWINPQEPLNAGFDGGLRTALMLDPAKAILELPRTLSEDGRPVITHILDRYQCNYLLFPMVGDEMNRALLIGPWSTEQPTSERVEALAQSLSIPAPLQPFMIQYYSTIPLMSMEETARIFIETMARMITGEDGFVFQRFQEQSRGASAYLRHPGAAEDTRVRLQLEQRYEIENQMIDLIAHGDSDGAIRCMENPLFSSLDIRTTEVLRTRKNYLLVLNTLCRKGAERGQVHPIHLDETSRIFTRRIEQLTSGSQVTALTRELIRKYCQLVRQYATKGYSSLVSNTINDIDLKLRDEHLTLQLLAASRKVNKSYLSTLFRQETGQTVTEYIHTRRMDQAIFLLNTTTDSIAEIGDACGIPDTTYFIRLFKKRTGMTPAKYRRMLAGD